MERADRATGGRIGEFRMMNGEFRKKFVGAVGRFEPPIASGDGLGYTIKPSPFRILNSAF
jgi:hypothetical protein